MSCHRETYRRPLQLAWRALLLGALALPVLGCGLFRPPPPPPEPETVSEWMKQPRVGEAPDPEDEEQ